MHFKYIMKTMTYHQEKILFDLGKTPGYRSGSWQQQQQWKKKKNNLSIRSKSNQFDEWILYTDMPDVANSECIMNRRNTGITYLTWFIIIKVLELKTKTKFMKDWVLAIFRHFCSVYQRRNVSWHVNFTQRSRESCHDIIC